MKGIINNAIGIVFGFGSGVIIAGAVFAFIAVIGVVPRLAQKTRTAKFIKIYEEAIIVGGIIGNCLYFLNKNMEKGFRAPIRFFLLDAVLAIGSLFTGIFYGCVTMSLAEVINVIPILGRRAKVERGLSLFILIIAIGKLTGALIYFIVPGFKK